jgi:hypothetical protein
MLRRVASQLSRRAFLRTSGAFALLGLAPVARVDALIAETAAPGSRHGRFLRADELDALRAVTARLVPGPPADPGPGALEVRAAEAIDLLLGSFELEPPLIHAGGPFSGRAGGGRDDFARFVPLDRRAELGWRIRLEGSRGLPEREFAGPVIGLQEIYRTGLGRLEELAGARSAVAFAAAPPSTQDALLDSRDGVVVRLIYTALANTLEAVCGAPEYGGNRRLAGWRALGWEGDRQPAGFSHARVSRPDPPADPGSARLAGVSLEASEALTRIAPLLAGRGEPIDRLWSVRRGLGGR